MRRFGDYLLVSLLGRGGMAEVFRARRFGPAGFERSVVVKRIRDVYTRDHTFVQLFVNEAKIAAQLSHPNIVQIYDFGEVEGEYFIAMEYVRGKDLLWLVRQMRKASGDERGARLPFGVAAYIMREVCRGLAHAHGQLDPTGQPAPIVHRDVSPQNIMVTYDGHVKLVDFGIAKALASAAQEDTKGAVFKGKYAYMSPEQAIGESPGPESDVFCAGIVMHEILTGLRLFRGDTDLDTVKRVRGAVVKPPSELVPGIPPELDRIVMKALERDRRQRYDRAASMARDLDAFLRAVHVSVEQMTEWMSETVPGEERDLTNDSQVLLGEAPMPAAAAPSAFAGEVSPSAAVGSRRLLMLGGGALVGAAIVGAIVAYSMTGRAPAPPSSPAEAPSVARAEDMGPQPPAPARARAAPIAAARSAEAPSVGARGAPSAATASAEAASPGAASDETPSGAAHPTPTPRAAEAQRAKAARAVPAPVRKPRVSGFEDERPKIEAFE